MKRVWTACRRQSRRDYVQETGQEGIIKEVDVLVVCSRRRKVIEQKAGRTPPAQT